jgi:hypothetical protein
MDRGRLELDHAPNHPQGGMPGAGDVDGVHTWSATHDHRRPQTSAAPACLVLDHLPEGSASRPQGGKPIWT